MGYAARAAPFAFRTGVFGSIALAGRRAVAGSLDDISQAGCSAEGQVPGIVGTNTHCFSTRRIPFGRSVEAMDSALGFRSWREQHVFRPDGPDNSFCAQCGRSAKSAVMLENVAVANPPGVGPRRWSRRCGPGVSPTLEPRFRLGSRPGWRQRARRDRGVGRAVETGAPAYPNEKRIVWGWKHFDVRAGRRARNG